MDSWKSPPQTGHSNSSFRRHLICVRVSLYLNRKIVENARNHNLNLSFGKALVKDKSNASVAITSIPEDQFFLETDDENISIIEIYQAATMLKKISFTALKNNQIENFKNAFRDDQL